MDKIYKKYQGHTIENGFSETSPDFKKFASYVKKRMKIAAADRGIVLEDFIVGHYFISGFFRKNEKWAYFSFEELKEYIIHFFEDSFDPEEKGHKDAEDWESIPGTRYDIPDTRHEYTSCTAGDYGPGNPWDAPGMSIRDFI